VHWTNKNFTSFQGFEFKSYSHIRNSLRVSKMFSLNSYLLYGSEEKLISAEVKIRLQFPVLKKRLLLVFNLIILEKQRKKIKF
jgi:hypothetical protein